jgi:hypothetical protein
MSAAESSSATRSQNGMKTAATRSPIRERRASVSGAPLPSPVTQYHLDSLRGQRLEALARPCIERGGPLAPAEDRKHLLLRVEAQRLPGGRGRHPHNLAADGQARVPRRRGPHAGDPDAQGKVDPRGKRPECAYRQAGNPVRLVERHRDAQHAPGHRRGRRREAAKSDDRVGALGPHEPKAVSERRHLRGREPRHSHGVPRESPAGHALETQPGVFLDQARVHLLHADEEGCLVPARREALGERDARRDVAPGAAAGDEEPAHARTSRIDPAPFGSPARPQVRWVLIRMPTSRPMSRRLDRPALMKGSDIPLVGRTPVTTPRLMID